MENKPKLLILAGASVHCKLVESAKEMGIYTIVTDYLQDSPAKKIADESWNININDIDKIVEKCKAENVNGVITGWIDPCQRPYQKICELLNLPCYGTEEQFLKLTDKHAFKKLCKENNVGIIEEYEKEDIQNGKVEYPVFVKPVDSRGSRGQSICNNYEETIKAIEEAEKESSNGDILVEKYMADLNSFQVTYFFIDGKPYVIRTADGYKGTIEEKLDKVALCSISPSAYTNEYFKYAHENVVAMLKNLGIKNGPVMMQGFYYNEKFYFYDPGFRFPGVDYDIIYKKIFNIDVMKMMVEFALYGKITDVRIDNNNVYLNGNNAIILFPTVSAGKIKEIIGIDELKINPNITSISTRYKVGDTVNWDYNVNQRVAEINLVCEKNSVIESILKIQNTLKVIGTNGENMIYKPLDTNRIIL